SEIFERKVQKHLIMEQLSLPDIPENYIAKFPDIYEMYKLIRSCKKYNVFIKDGSIGRGYPVCVLIIVEKDTGRFGVKIGSHPDYHIALERLFTEATQGINIESFAQKSIIDFSNTNVSTVINLQNSFKTGDAAYPYQIFSSKPDFEFVEPKDFSSSSNKEMLDHSIELLKNEGCDLLIHDTSYLGFPSFHIIVPGFSEMNIASKNDFEADNTRFHMQKYLSKPEQINRDCVKYLISVINYYQHSLQSNNFKDFSGNLISDKLPGTDIGVDLLYYKAMLYIYIKDYLRAYETISLIYRIVKSSIASPDEAEYFYILKNYVHGMATVKDHDTVIDCLSKLFSEKFVERIDDLFADNEKVLVKQFKTYNESEDPDSFRKLITVTESYCRCQNIHLKDGNNAIKELFA
ncbi:MAG: YcaO-like family protein, partial [Ruminococcus sp.]|nr:YcaO-like family protein [Ruminococcus sp.]